MPAGRPPLPPHLKQRPTKLVRMYAEQADKIGWFLKLEGNDESLADFLESTCGTETDNRYAPVSKRVEIIKAAERGDDIEAVFANDLGGEGG